MNLRLLKFFLLATFASLVIILFATPAAAQQVTYYSFDGASSSFSCPTEGGGAILCVNDGLGGSGSGFPQFVSETCQPDDTRCPYLNDPHGSGQALELTPAQQSQRSSVWFSIPQKVTNGFTSYFAFRLTPAPPVCTPGTDTCNPVTTADGISFAIQNAQGGSSGSTGSGLNIVGGGGGFMGYGGIDNSLVTEFDTFKNSEFSDPSTDLNSTPGFSFAANHIAVQSCGVSANSPTHLAPVSGGCLIGAVDSQVTVNMADGDIHEVVIEYGGSPSNQLQIYIDPPFQTGTHTVEPGTAANLTTSYDLGTLNLISTNCPDNCVAPFDSAYVGFTAATGGSYETQTLLSWTFTPHTPATQEQPISNPGTQTTFPFGAHTYTVKYDPDNPPSPPVTGIDMIVDAYPIAPLDFEALLVGTQFAGSKCQVYGGTGAKCIVYSVHCINDGSPDTPVPCPSTTNPTIAIKTAYESDENVPVISPGYLQGDPFFTPISTITGDGATSTATCKGECAITAPQTVTIAGNGSGTGGFNGTVNVTSATIDSFTFNSSVNGTADGGFVSSNKLQNICNTDRNDPPCFQTAKIDGTTSGKTKNFSSFAALSVTQVLQSISVTPSPASLNVPNTQQFVATGTYQDASTQNITNIVTWGSSDPSKASITTGGLATALSAGPTNITATLGGITGTSLLTVSGSNAPQFTSAATTTFTAGIAGSFNVTASGTPAPTFKVYSGSLPSGVSLSSSGLLKSSNSAKAGTYNFGIKATNGKSPDATQAFSLIIQQPVGSISLSPTSLAFGDVFLGTRTHKAISITNTSSQPVMITKLTFTAGTGPSRNDYGYDFECGDILKPGQKCTVTIELHAQDIGPGTSTLNIFFNGPTAQVPLSGNVINPKAKLSTSSLSFGNVKVGTSATKPVTLTNNGDSDLLISNIALSGQSDFSKTASTCPATLARNLSCTVTIKFTPTAKSTRTGTLKFTDNANPSTQSVSLTGKGN